MAGEPVLDSEVLLRRIPPGEAWLEPPDRLTSANFKLDRRRNEQGLSVYREKLVTVEDVLKKPGAIHGSRIAAATAGDVRALRNAEDQPLGLEVVPCEDATDVGHAEIRGTQPGRLSASASRALSRLFKLRA
ncbi:MAG: hypothetical protein HY721_16960 [Planctomycetes bacterium]|nr:hypothetical protein [Planctomycetota bacterium]